MALCANCSATFRKKEKGYHRHSLESVLPTAGKPARVHLQDLTGTPVTPKSKADGEFLCPSCWNQLKGTFKYQQAVSDFFTSTKPTSYVGCKRPQSELIDSPDSDRPTMSFFKRPRFTSTPLKTNSKVARSMFGTYATPKPSKWDTIITAIRARQYRRAIMGIYNATAGTKRHFIEIAGRIVRKEVCDLLKSNDFPLCADVDIPSIADFSWDKTLDIVSQTAPLLFNVIRGAVTKKQNQDSMTRSSVNLKPRIGTSLAILLHSKAPRKANFLQTLFSVQFWRGRLKRETIKQLSHLGICVSYESTLSAIDKVRLDFDAGALRLKEKIKHPFRITSKLSLCPRKILTYLLRFPLLFQM